jgi:hypothetical protein
MMSSCLAAMAPGRTVPARHGGNREGNCDTQARATPAGGRRKITFALLLTTIEAVRRPREAVVLKRHVLTSRSMVDFDAARRRGGG